MSTPLRAESAYPYVSRNQPCKLKQLNLKTNYPKATGYYGPYTIQDKELIKAQVYLTTISIGIAAANSFQYYSTGIYATDCNKTPLNHAIQVIGWGSVMNADGTSIEYWIAKNQWDAYWGEQGYMKIQMINGTGVCGMNLEISYAKA
eukprot:403344149